MTPFHLAFPVRDLAATRAFYADLLGCAIGRQSDTWIDFDFFGHQITAHAVGGPSGEPPTSDVDGKGVPIPHFGAVLEWSAWHALADRLRAVGTQFVIEPYIRFEGQVGEQATMFLTDPSGNSWSSSRSRTRRCCLRPSRDRAATGAPIRSDTRW